MGRYGPSEPTPCRSALRVAGNLRRREGYRDKGSAGKGRSAQGEDDEGGGGGGFAQRAEDVAGDAVEAAAAVPEQGLGGEQAGGPGEGGAQRGEAAEGYGRGAGGGAAEQGGGPGRTRREGAGDRGAESAGPGRRYAFAAGERHRRTARRPGRDRRGAAVHPAVAVAGRERRGLGEQDEDEGEHAERSDVRLLHDPQRVLGGLAAAQPVRGVGEPVQVQSPGQYGGYGHRGHRRQQWGRPECGQYA